MHILLTLTEVLAHLQPTISLVVMALRFHLPNRQKPDIHLHIGHVADHLLIIRQDSLMSKVCQMLILLSQQITLLINMSLPIKLMVAVEQIKHKLVHTVKILPLKVLYLLAQAIPLIIGQLRLEAGH